MKRATVDWKQYQNSSIPKKQHEAWKAECAFSKGMVIMAGRVWHLKETKGLYLILIDADKIEAIREI